MKDVATAAGVSLKTVSRVVNAEAGVTAGLAARVHAAIDSLGYQPDLRARELRGQKQGPATIGFIQTTSANPFFSQIRSALEEAAAERGCLILSGSSGAQSARQEALIEALAGRRVDGFVIVPAIDDPGTVPTALQHEVDRGTPVVFVDRATTASVDTVLSDHRGGAALATHHLLDAGHRRIVFLGRGGNLLSTVERVDGFESTVADRLGRDALGKETTTLTDIDPAQAEATVTALFSQPEGRRPTAIFSGQNQLTKGAVRALHLLGLHTKVALVGFDDVEMANVIQPGLSVIAQDAELLGQTAAELLFDRLESGRTTSVRRIVPVKLIARGSGEIGPDAGRPT